jgi:hypothetical protein
MVWRLDVGKRRTGAGIGDTNVDARKRRPRTGRERNLGFGDAMGRGLGSAVREREGRGTEDLGTRTSTRGSIIREREGRGTGAGFGDAMGRGRARGLCRRGAGARSTGHGDFGEENRVGHAVCGGDGGGVVGTGGGTEELLPWVVMTTLTLLPSSSSPW